MDSLNNVARCPLTAAEDLPQLEKGFLSREKALLGHL